MFTRKNIFLCVALFYTLYIIFPLFSDVMRFPVWLPSMLSTVVMIQLFPNALKNKMMYWFGVYAIVLTFFVIIGKPLTIGIGTVADSKKIFIEFAYILPTLCLFSIFYYLKDYHLIKKYVSWSTIILFISFVVAVPLMIRYNSLREALAKQSETFDVPGLPSYSLMHAYTLFVPVVCFYHKYTSGKWKLIGFAALLALFFVVYSTFVTTSLIIMIVIMFFAYTYNDRQRSLYWLFLFLTAIVLYVFYEAGLLVDLIDWIQPFFAGTPVEPKLENVRNILLEGQITGGTIVERQRLHGISWNSFLDNPFWGTSIVGSHSSLLDRFGGMGMIAGIPFLMIFITFFNSFKKMLCSPNVRAFFTIGAIAGFMFLYEKGNWGAESWFFFMVLMPMGLYVADGRDVERQE